MSDINELNDRPRGAEENLAAKKGIKLFLDDEDQIFLEGVGREITNDIIQESFVLYRVDLKKTQTHSLYKESKRKVWLPEVEVYGRINVEKGSIESQVRGGIIGRKFGDFAAHVYLSHLEEMNLISKDDNSIKFNFRIGDFIGHKGQFYKIIDDGLSNISNQYSFGGDRRFYISIVAIETNEDVFKGR